MIVQNREDWNTSIEDIVCDRKISGGNITIAENLSIGKEGNGYAMVCTSGFR